MHGNGSQWMHSILHESYFVADDDALQISSWIDFKRCFDHSSSSLPIMVSISSMYCMQRSFIYFWTAEGSVSSGWVTS